MSEQQAQPTDTLIIEDDVIEKITGVVTREIPGILDMKGSMMSDFATTLGAASKSSRGVTAIVEGVDCSIEIKAILEYGFSAPEIFEQIKTSVRREIKNMTGLDVKNIQFRVVDVMSREEFERNSKESAKKASGQPPVQK